MFHCCSTFRVKTIRAIGMAKYLVRENVIGFHEEYPHTPEGLLQAQAALLGQIFQIRATKDRDLIDEIPGLAVEFVHGGVLEDVWKCPAESEKEEAAAIAKALDKEKETEKRPPPQNPYITYNAATCMSCGMRVAKAIYCCQCGAPFGTVRRARRSKKRKNIVP